MVGESVVTTSISHTLYSVTLNKGDSYCWKNNPFKVLYQEQRKHVEEDDQVWCETNGAFWVTCKTLHLVEN